MNNLGMPEGFIADPNWLKGVAIACRHTVDLIYAHYKGNPTGLSVEDVTQLNVASAYLYLYNSAIEKENLDVMIPDDVTWH